MRSPTAAKPGLAIADLLVRVDVDEEQVGHDLCDGTRRHFLALERSTVRVTIP